MVGVVRGVRGASPSITMASGPPSWVQPDWKDDDIFTLAKTQLDHMKLRVASMLKCRYKVVCASQPYAEDVAGIMAIDDRVLLHIMDYTKLRDDGKPVQTEGEGDTAFSTRVAQWKSELSMTCKVTCTINGCMIDWSSSSGPWNAGYIGQFWSKFESGEKTWDPTIDRKAGGATVSPDMSFDGLNLSVVSASSVMALIRAVCGQVMRTGTCDETLARHFRSIRVTWLLEASSDEIVTMSMSENIEQHTRRRHTELDNLFQVRTWMEMMPVTAAGLDPKKALDVVRYALAMGDPLNPFGVPSWMTGLLRGAPVTPKNKLAAIATAGVTKRFIDDNKIKISHPEMNSYQRVVQRVRAVNGFKEWDLLHHLVVEEMGRRGLAHKPCPLTSHLLLDPSIYTSDAFVTKSERENVPAWRDGAPGKELQTAMCEVARARLFDFGGIDSTTTKAVFLNGAHWAAFARMCGPPTYHLDVALGRAFDGRDAWPDSVKATHRSIWAGDHDVELAKLCSVLPSNMDAQPSVMQKRLLEGLTPLVQVIEARGTEAQRLQTAQEKKDEEEKKKEAENPEVREVCDVPKSHDDGDVTDALFLGQDAAAKRKMCNKLNKDAMEKRDGVMQKQFNAAAAEVCQTKLTWGVWG